MLFKIKRLALRSFWIFFKILPVKREKIVLISYSGMGYSDNPKYIAEELIKSGGYDIYWAVRGKQEAETLPTEITPIPYRGISLAYHLSTARVWIDNSRKFLTFKKSGQLYVQTWHGGPACMKRIEKDASSSLDADYVRTARHDSQMIDIIVSSSDFRTNQYKKSFWYDGEVLQVGSPRNDLFYSRDKTGLVDRVKESIGVPSDNKFVLYAPTFRRNGTLEPYNLDFDRALDSLRSKFGGEWTLVLRLHPNVSKRSKELKIPDSALDGTGYPDMQELLLASDCLITDYSSSIFDYILLNKPGFLYCTDYAEYSKDRGVYFNINKLPFPLSTNDKELEKNILNFDVDRFRQNSTRLLQDIGPVETSTASRAVVDWIQDNTKHTKSEQKRKS